MMEAGHGLQIVNVTDDHKYSLDEKELERLLLREDVKDLPVVVVSVAGAYRGGKSFLLNFFLRYLTSPLSDREDGSWLGEDSAPLVGFTWRSGIKATTAGILMWSEPFITTLPSGDKVAVLLVDTQGNFDNRSTVRDNSTVFALSTLLSSIQIYNISLNIKEDDLQHLELFTEYGKLMSAGNTNVKAFQVLEFLVRDWQFPQDYPYGAVGGERMLQNKLEITKDLQDEMKNLRRHIRSSFEKVSCFLMPHPGFNVLKKTFTGNITDIDSKFRTHLKDLVTSIFSPENLLPKSVNGEQVKARELFNYFKTYMELFSSDEVPSPTNIFVATVKSGLLSAVSEARDVYEKGMDSECGPKQLSVPVVDIEFLHKKYMALASAAYTHRKKLGSAEEALEYQEQLTKALNERLPLFLQSNHAKILTAINNAKNAYDEAIKNISKGELICVHSKDLKAIHNIGVDAAIKKYDAARKRITQKKDEERDTYIKSFEKQFELLRRDNERNNTMVVNEIWMIYWREMQTKAAVEPPLSERELEDEHTKAQEKALQDFALRRNKPNNYTEDVYKFNLIKEIQASYVFLKLLNNSKNKEAMRDAIEEYDNYFKENWNNITECLHPNDLEEIHRVAICEALTTYRPQKMCSAGFDYSNSDETTLYEVLNQRHQSFIESNEKANELAVSIAYNEYVSTMEALSGFSPTWLLVVPYIIRNMNVSKYHEESKRKAHEMFYSKRRNEGQHSSDPYQERLDQMIMAQYAKQYKSQDWSTVKPIVDALKGAQGGDGSSESSVLQSILSSLPSQNGENQSQDSSWLQSILQSVQKETS